MEVVILLTWTPKDAGGIVEVRRINLNLRFDHLTSLLQNSPSIVHYMWMEQITSQEGAGGGRDTDSYLSQLVSGEMCITTAIP